MSSTSFKSSFDETEGLEKSLIIIDNVDDNAHLVFGWANISIKQDGDIPLDWEGDITAPNILEKAAYNFVLNFRVSGEEHEGEALGHLVESVMFTKQKMTAMGIPLGIVPEGWWVGFYIPDDEVYEKVRSGVYKMFSIQGRARRLNISDI